LSFFCLDPTTPTAMLTFAGADFSQILFVIKEPDVFKTDSGSKNGPATYVVFGKAEIEDLSAQATSAAVEQFKAPSADVSSPPRLERWQMSAVTREERKQHRAGEVSPCGRLWIIYPVHGEQATVGPGLSTRSTLSERKTEKRAFCGEEWCSRG